MSYNIKIKTATPIHIGSGKTIGLFEFKRFGNKLYLLNSDRCFRFVLDQIGEDGLDKLDKWAEEKSAEIDAYGQSKGQKEYEIDVFNFVEKYLRDKELSEKLKDKIISDKSFTLYKFESGKDINKTVSEIIKTAKNELYIPGSSIKGMLRTALIVQYLYDNIDWGWLHSNLKNINISLEGKINNKQNIGDKDKNIDKFLQKEIFKCGCEVYNKGDKNEDFSDEKYDLMKFIHITDTNSIPVEEGGCIIEPKIYLTNGKEQGQLNIYEAIKKNQEFEARISIDLDYLLSLKSKLPNIRDTKGNRIWIKLEEKFKKLFGVELRKLSKESKNEFEDKIISKIDQAVCSMSVLEINKESIIPNKKLDPFYSELSENAIKLGWASQFYGTTIYEVLLSSSLKDFEINREENSQEKLSQDEKEKITKQLSKQNQDIYTKLLNLLNTAKKDIKDPDNFPISRRYHPFAQNSLETLGWVEIDFE